MAKKLKEFKIRRKGWLRGKDAEATASLRNESGSMCCLGFFARSCGVPADCLVNVGLPSHLDLHLKNEFIPDGILDVDSDIATVNDSEDLTPAQREKKLTAMFKKVGYKPIFV